MSASDIADETTAVVLAGGKGTRLGALTREICKPALPFGAAYRTIDFTLSNCLNSGLRRIGVAVQHQPQVLLRHLRDRWEGRVDGERGQFIEAWSAEERAPAYGYAGTADAVFRNLEAIERTGCDLVLVLAGDHVYKMDYRDMLDFHRRHRADVTVGAIEVPVEDAHHYGILSTDAEGRVASFVEKPRHLASEDRRVVASMGIYAFDARFLAGVLRGGDREGRAWLDFGHDLLPALVRDARVFAFPFRTRRGEPGYWRDVGTPAAYWRAHLELLGEAPSLRLDDPDWPLGADSSGGPQLTSRRADRSRSLLATHATVRGTLRRSVLFEGACVSPGAVVEDSVVLPGAHVGAACRLRGVIVDRDCRIPDGTVVHGPRAASRALDSAEPVVVTASDFEGASWPARSAVDAVDRSASLSEAC